MTFTEIKSHTELTEKLKGKEKTYLLLYKKGSSPSDCAYENIAKSIKGNENFTLLAADVLTVRDIHEKYSVTSVPALLSFENSEFKNIIKGCNDSKYYKAMFENAVFIADSVSKGSSQKRVIVYSTPSCSWCVRLKNYLKDNKIKFRDIDVSKDQKVAAEMVKRSGQQGVPQSLIGGQVIIGFDKAKIDKLLGLQ